MKKYNVLIIGAGGQGALADAPGSLNQNKIISFAHAFKEHQGFRLEGFYDVDIKRAADAARAWKTEYWAGWPVCVDVIVIATDDNNHYEPLKKALEHKPKLVICEKPLCTDLQQAREIVELYQAKGIPLMVDNTRNFIPCLRSLNKDHGKAISGYCLFNRGWLHSAVHAVGFFKMLGLTNYKVREVKNLDFRVWVLSACFEDGYVWSEERITDGMPVPEYCNLHMKYVVENAFGFLEGKEPLIYTGEMALKDMETCFSLM